MSAWHDGVSPPGQDAGLVEAAVSASGEALPGGRSRGGTRKVVVAGRAVVVRRLRRGGALRAFLPDLFLDGGRGERERSVTARALAAGIPVVEVLGVRTRRRWGTLGLLHEIHVVTPHVEAPDVLAHLLGGGGAAPELCRSAARAVASLARAGILHRDLQAGNLLWREAAGACLVLDLDRAREGVAPGAAAREMALRLGRSIAKWGLARRAVSRAARMRFLRVLSREGGLPWEDVRAWMRLRPGGGRRWA
ncbi:MAG: hypothetical protein HY608_01490 [Planctomycetes bacterium]|nr:hypothetical protein [Planctomycetota bacterium]